MGNENSAPVGEGVDGTTGEGGTMTPASGMVDDYLTDRPQGDVHDGNSHPQQQQQQQQQRMASSATTTAAASFTSSASSARNSIMATIKSSHNKLIRQNQKVKFIRQSNNNKNTTNNNKPPPRPQQQQQQQQQPNSYYPSSFNTNVKYIHRSNSQSSHDNTDMNNNHHHQQHMMNVYYSYGARNDSSDHLSTNHNTSALEDDMRNMTIQPSNSYEHPLHLRSQQQQQHYLLSQQQQQQQQQYLQPTLSSLPSSSPTKTGLSNDEEDWRNAWEEDVESSEEEEEEEDDDDDIFQRPNVATTSNSHKAPYPNTSSRLGTGVVPDLFRTSMDGGHSSSSPIKHHSATPSMSRLHHTTSAMASSGELLLQQQQQQQQQKQQQQQMYSQNHHHPIDHDRELTRQADRALMEGSNAVRWDMTPRAGMDYEKPNVKMFSPFLRVLGKGAFGKVVLVQKQSGDEKGNLFAMKILRKSHLVRQKQIERTKTERKVLTMIDHPFIMKLHYAFQTEDKLYLVLDYSAGGELFFHLSRHQQFPEWVAKFYAAELLLALSHMHLNGIIYRDLKPENVLLDADGHVKLGDFGLAKDCIQHAYKGATSVCGTPEYMAPEILNQTGHGFCVDYWGLGMLIYEMMTGLPPWYTTDREKLFDRLRFGRLKIPTYFSPQAAQCVSALLQKNPRNRLGVMGVRSVIAHQFFASINFRTLRARGVDPPIRPMEGWDGNQTNNNNGFHYQQESPPPLSDANIDQVTKCFDQKFTRMPVESSEGGDGNASQDDDDDEFNDQAFVGFTFDEVVDSDERNRDQSSPTHHQKTKINGGGSTSSRSTSYRNS